MVAEDKRLMFCGVFLYRQLILNKTTTTDNLATAAATYN